MSDKKILVFAYSDVGHACLKFLLERGEPVVGVFTHEYDPKETAWFPSVKALAKMHGVPVWTAEQSELAGLASVVESMKPDLIFSFYYRFLIPDAILMLPKLGAFNMHGSLLPKFRGRAPVNWAVLHGETETGATLHRMTAKADAGDIVDAEAVPIDLNDTASAVQSKVTKAAVIVLGRQIDLLKNGTAVFHPQNHELATKFGRRRPEDGRIDWTRSSLDVHNLIRAVSHPYPGAFTEAFGRRAYIWESLLTDLADPKAQAGETRIQGGDMIVFCGDGKGLSVRRAQWEGEPETTGASFFTTIKRQREEAVK